MACWRVKTEDKAQPVSEPGTTWLPKTSTVKKEQAPLASSSKQEREPIVPSKFGPKPPSVPPLWSGFVKKESFPGDPKPSRVSPAQWPGIKQERAVWAPKPPLVAPPHWLASKPASAPPSWPGPVKQEGGVSSPAAPPSKRMKVEQQSPTPYPRGSVKHDIEHRRSVKLEIEKRDEAQDESDDVEWYADEEAEGETQPMIFKKEEQAVEEEQAVQEQAVEGETGEEWPETDTEESLPFCRGCHQVIESHHKLKKTQSGNTWHLACFENYWPSTEVKSCVKCKQPIHSESHRSSDVRKPWHAWCWDAHLLITQAHCVSDPKCQGCKVLRSADDTSKEWHQSNSKKWWCDACWKSHWTFTTTDLPSVQPV